MTVDEFIQTHFKDFQDVCRAYLGNTPLADDLLQEATLILLKKRNDPKLKCIIDKGEGMYHFAGIVKMMVTRKRHKFHYGFISRKPIDKYEYIASQEQMADDIEKLNEVDEIIAKLRWYKKELWRLYFDEGYSFTKLADETGISRKSLYNDLTKLKEEVKSKIKEK